MNWLILFITVYSLITVGCAGAADAIPSTSQESQNDDHPVDPAPEFPATPPPEEETPRGPLLDSEIELDSYGESFQAKIATKLQNARYMEKNCGNVSTWNEWENFPMKWCRYRSNGQNAEVLMLNPGPRRLTQWLEEACGSFAGNFDNCMNKAFNQILYQSGGQFPVAGVVIEDMDGDNRGNAYAFRNGVTIQVAAFSTATESIISDSQISRAFTDPAIKTYTYGRPISLTREQLTSYARDNGLQIPTLGSSSQRLNVYNEVLGDLYRKAWYSSQNHIIRAWVYAQAL